MSDNAEFLQVKLRRNVADRLRAVAARLRAVRDRPKRNGQVALSMTEAVEVLVERQERALRGSRYRHQRHRFATGKTDKLPEGSNVQPQTPLMKTPDGPGGGEQTGSSATL